MWAHPWVCFDGANRFTSEKDADRNGQGKSRVNSKHETEADRQTGEARSRFPRPSLSLAAAGGGRVVPVAVAPYERRKCGRLHAGAPDGNPLLVAKDGKLKQPQTHVARAVIFAATSGRQTFWIIVVEKTNCAQCTASLKDPPLCFSQKSDPCWFHLAGA